VEVAIGPTVVGNEEEGLLGLTAGGLLAGDEAEAIVVIETHQFAAIAIGDVGVATEDQVVLVVAGGGRAREVVGAADDGGVVGGKVDDDEFGVDQDVAALLLAGGSCRSIANPRRPCLLSGSMLRARRTPVVPA
jgi:hypothetical protein